MYLINNNKRKIQTMIDANQLLKDSVIKNAKSLPAYEQDALLKELSKAGNLELVKYMLEEVKADVGYDGFAPYHWAKNNKIKKYLRDNYEEVREHLKYRKQLLRDK